MPKPSPRKHTLSAIHNFVRDHEGDRAAYDWLVSTVSRLADQVEEQKREITTLKARLTRLRK